MSTAQQQQAVQPLLLKKSTEGWQGACGHWPAISLRQTTIHFLSLLLSFSVHPIDRTLVYISALQSTKGCKKYEIAKAVARISQSGKKCQEIKEKCREALGDSAPSGEPAAKCSVLVNW